MDAEAKVMLTPAEAESLLNEEGEYIHNFIQSGPVFLGCDYDRADAIAAFKSAKSIEIGGPACKQMKHPLAVFDKDGRLSFFEADLAKVEAFEATQS